MGGTRTTLVIVLAFGWAAISIASSEELPRFPALPDPVGVAGPYAGVSHGALLVAGGANFPGKKPWEGGQKIWHDAVYVLEPGRDTWQVAGKLPRPAAYGVSVSHRDALICAGGGDAGQAFDQVFRLTWHAGKLHVQPLARLPQKLVNACGALVGDRLYVAGGQSSPESQVALKTFYCLDLANPQSTWQTIDSWPGPGRILATACGWQQAFWLFGGGQLQARVDGPPARVYLRDAYRYSPDKGWQKLPPLPTPLLAAPSPAPCQGQSIYLLGGDDGSQVATPQAKHSGFSRNIWQFDVQRQQWSAAGLLNEPRVTVPCVRWQQAWVIPSGEVKPGIRSPAVSAWNPPR